MIIVLNHNGSRRFLFCMGAFTGLCKEVDDTYTCSSVFVTVNMPAYQYGHTDDESPIRIIPALDLMEDPMLVFGDEDNKQ